MKLFRRLLAIFSAIPCPPPPLPSTCYTWLLAYFRIFFCARHILRMHIPSLYRDYCLVHNCDYRHILTNIWLLLECFAIALAKSSPIITVPSWKYFKQKWSQTGILVCYFPTVREDKHSWQPSSEFKGCRVVVLKCTSAIIAKSCFQLGYWMSKITL